ncbi:hypothetical protein [Turicimonas muris]|uniref:hypothetical protein n=1 Tax=Turicimonas muris TaxID=1796652 RepID=UPI003F66369F
MLRVPGPCGDASIWRLLDADGETIRGAKKQRLAMTQTLMNVFMEQWGDFYGSARSFYELCLW